MDRKKKRLIERGKDRIDKVLEVDHLIKTQMLAKVAIKVDPHG